MPHQSTALWFVGCCLQSDVCRLLITVLIQLGLALVWLDANAIHNRQPTSHAVNLRCGAFNKNLLQLPPRQSTSQAVGCVVQLQLKSLHVIWSNNKFCWRNFQIHNSKLIFATLCRRYHHHYHQKTITANRRLLIFPIVVLICRVAGVSRFIVCAYSPPTVLFNLPYLWWLLSVIASCTMLLLLFFPLAVHACSSHRPSSLRHRFCHLFNHRLLLLPPFVCCLLVVVFLHLCNCSETSFKGGSFSFNQTWACRCYWLPSYCYVSGFCLLLVSCAIAY